MKAAVGLLLAAGALMLARVASATEYGNWNVSFGQGWLSHTVSNGPGNEFSIDCDIGANQHPQTAIRATIIGKPPPIRSEITVVLDGSDQLELFADEQGTIGTECHVCADTFTALWGKLFKSKSMRVQFADGRSSKFLLNGARRALGADVCRLGYSSP